MLVHEQFKEVRPYGSLSLGHTDPSSRTQLDFDRSSELLYHGTSCTFELSSDYDYLSSTHLKRDNSATLGPGLYTTSSFERANDYAELRSADAGGEQQATTFLCTHSQ